MNVFHNWDSHNTIILTATFAVNHAAPTLGRRFCFFMRLSPSRDFPAFMRLSHATLSRATFATFKVVRLSGSHALDQARTGAQPEKIVRPGPGWAFRDAPNRHRENRRSGTVPGKNRAKRGNDQRHQRKHARKRHKKPLKIDFSYIKVKVIK